MSQTLQEVNVDQPQLMASVSQLLKWSHPLNTLQNTYCYYFAFSCDHSLNILLHLTRLQKIADTVGTDNIGMIEPDGLPTIRKSPGGFTME